MLFFELFLQSCMQFIIENRQINCAARWLKYPYLHKLACYFTVMPQLSVSDFFKPSASGAKRSATQAGNDTTPEKKKRGEDKGGLSPEQLKRMDENRAKALSKLMEGKNARLMNLIGSSWKKVLDSEINQPYCRKLLDFVEQERKSATIYPPENQVFTWTQMCTIEEIKVVILGQDPYHGPKQAHGLCFSVQKGVAIPPSLRNMYKELEQDIPEFQAPSHGDLTEWAKQGVLLLNACLTVRAGQPNSHKDKGWEKLTDAVIKWLSKNSRHIAFLLWGAYAQKKGASISKDKHLILKCAHPSPLSATRFFGCRHFSKANEYLTKNGRKPIDWAKL
ncbi:Uracil-DNA glycosylase [Trichoplax sp. H2]|nr:Uracil-DNA glycosylase [Trichoplax sp. H2]|eukprot:RDD40527.1 Uracil-DNA glycosylase [Trichoplax sp. H2]